jgi:hypothetical protein
MADRPIVIMCLHDFGIRDLSYSMNSCSNDANDEINRHVKQWVGVGVRSGIRYSDLNPDGTKETGFILSG